MHMCVNLSVWKDRCITHCFYDKQTDISYLSVYLLAYTVSVDNLLKNKKIG